MPKTKSELLLDAYSAFNRRDIDAVLALMSPDVDWPNGMDGGRVFGHDQVREYWTRQWSLVNPHVHPVSIKEAADDRVEVSVHQVVRDLSGVVLVDQRVEHIYTFKDGVIERMDIRAAGTESSDGGTTNEYR